MYIPVCCLFLLICLYGLTARGQGTDEKGKITTGKGYPKNDFVKAMKEMADRYRDSKSLSFNVTYRYSSEKDPGVYLDSLKGSYRINGNDYWYSLDNTEVVSNQDYCVLLFKEDHIMYLAPARSRNTNIDFLSSLDSFLVHGDNITVSATEGPQQRILKLSFGDNSPWKSIEYNIDKTNGYIIRIRQVVRSSRLYDPVVAGSRAGMDNSYAIVDMDFTDYHTGAFDARQLDVGNYFKKEGGQYVVTASYNSYKIFLGAPNL